MWDWQRFTLIFALGVFVFSVVREYIRDNHRQNLGSVMVHIGSSSTPPQKPFWQTFWPPPVAFNIIAPGILFSCAWHELIQNEGGFPVHTLIACAIIAALFSLYKQNERLHGQKEPAA